MRAMIHVLEDGDDDGAVAGPTVVKEGHFWTLLLRKAMQDHS